MWWFAAGIGLILTGGAVALFAGERRQGWVAIAAHGAAAAVMLPGLVRTLLTGAGKSFTSGTLPLAGNILWTVDPLAAFFALIILAQSFLFAVYGRGYLRMYRRQGRPMGAHYAAYHLLTASMLLVVTAGNGLSFLFVWELMSLSSFWLVAFDNGSGETFRAAIHYLIAMHVGFLFLLAGFVLLGGRAGNFELSAFSAVLHADSRLAAGVFFLFLAGFGTKAGLVPLHSWLPQAHPAAPSHVSGLMSGVMLKTGIYGLLRFLSLSGPLPLTIAVAVVIIGLVTGLWGILFALGQRDLKRLLAYSSVENIGIILLGIGLSMAGQALGNVQLAWLGMAGALLHVVNHALFKGLLFSGAGAVYASYHTRDIERLGGVAKVMPVTAALFLAGAVAICGLPPLNGFVSEFMLYFGMAAGLGSAGPAMMVLFIAGIAGLSLIGAVALMTFAKAFGIVFLGQPRAAAGHPAEAAPAMIGPMVVMAAGCAAIGLLPRFAIRTVVEPVRTVIANTGGPESLVPVPAVLGAIASFFAGLMALFAALTGLLWLLSRRLPRESFKTWDCGYQAPNSRMQYSGGSFVQSLLELIAPVIRFRLRLQRPAGLFPSISRAEGVLGNPVESHMIRPAVARIDSFLRKFAWIQSGSTQQYILYGLLFLIVTLLWIVSQ